LGHGCFLLLAAVYTRAAHLRYMGTPLENRNKNGNDDGNEGAKKGHELCHSALHFPPPNKGLAGFRP